MLCSSTLDETALTMAFYPYFLYSVFPYALGMFETDEFEEEIANGGPFSHVRLTIFPDGGVSRLRLWGTIDHGV